MENWQEYQQLFEAAWDGDLEKLAKLTSPAPGRKPLVVCVQNFQGHTPLTIAAMRNHPACVKKIIQLAEQQYLPYSEKRVKEEEIKINNLDLAAGFLSVPSSLFFSSIFA